MSILTEQKIPAKNINMKIKNTEKNFRKKKTKRNRIRITKRYIYEIQEGDNTHSGLQSRLQWGGRQGRMKG